MITKIALSAWKRAFPFLSKDARGRIIDTVRKPIEVYNAGVQKGNENIAKELGATILDSKKYPTVAKEIDKRMGFLPDDPNGVHMAYGGVGLQDTIAAAKKRKGPAAGYVNKLKREVKDLNLNPNNGLVYVNNATVPTEVAADVNSDFIKNRILRHELLEMKDKSRYYARTPDGKNIVYKKDLRPNRPLLIDSNGKNVFEHNSLNVLRDELKHAFNSGFVDLHSRFGGALYTRNQSGELAALNHLGRLRGGSLGVADADGHVLIGDTKKAQKKFFRTLSKIQKKYDVRKADDIPSSAQPRYVLEDNYGYSNLVPVADDMLTGGRSIVLE